MEERYRILHKLSTTAPKPAMRAACRRQIRNLDWFEAVAIMRNDHRHPRLLRAFQLGTAACLDPRIRLTRFTLGAIRRLIFPNTV
jgi:hypothetical protein